ncbi:MAG TPA: hypothetical protein VM582_02940, partial [Candidatus Thermoplasmatota archaeon]|nr:hypothetical protein [Candidatus Thermoplasmatota archaeon]
QMPGAVAGGLAFMLVLLGAYAFPVVLVGGLVALEAYALGHLLRRRDLAWRARLLWLAAIVVLTPWFAAGAAAYALWGRRPAASAAAPA